MIKNVSCSTCVTVCAAVLFALVLATSASAQQRESMRLTFDGPVRLPTQTLPAGTYTFERHAEFATPVVTVFDATGRLVSINPVKPITRSGNGKSVVFERSASGSTNRIAAWYASNGRQGDEFVYRDAATQVSAEELSKLEKALANAERSVAEAKAQLTTSEASRMVAKANLTKAR